VCGGEMQVMGVWRWNAGYGCPYHDHNAWAQYALKKCEMCPQEMWNVCVLKKCVGEMQVMGVCRWNAGYGCPYHDHKDGFMHDRGKL